jgi:YVTN family beta-propeller protein
MKQTLVSLRLHRRCTVVALALACCLATPLLTTTAIAAAGPSPGHIATAPRIEASRYATARLRRLGAELVHGGRSDPAIPVGNGPQTTALDPATHTLYEVNGNDNTLSVIDTATCNAIITISCGETPPTVQTGSGPVSVAVDQITDTIYVTNSGDNTVSVINGATCNAQNTSGCGLTTTVNVGSVPVALDVNQATDTVYVANWGNGTGTTVSVINGATCNGRDTAGCGQAPASVTIGTGPAGVIVDQPTDTVYVGTVAPDNSEAVSVINGAICNGAVTSGCGQTPPSVTVGTGSSDFNVGFAIDQSAKTLYVANWTDNTLSMIDKATCNATVTSGCSQTPAVVNVGSGPTGIALDAAAHTIYTSNFNDATVSAIDAASCNAATTSGCGAQPAGSLRAGGGTSDVTVDPATGTIYTPNGDTNTVSVLNGASCNATITAGCTRFPATVPVGGQPEEPAVDDATRTVYVSNAADGTVSVINSAACNATVTAGCLKSLVATVPVGSLPAYLAVDQATDTVYVPNNNDNTVSVINGKTCNATITSGCGQTPPVVSVPGSPTAIAVNELTDSVYVGTGAGTVAVINGATCNSTVTTGCSQTPATVTTGDGYVGDIAVNPQTNTIYTANAFASAPDAISVIDGITCNATVTSGCSQTPPTATGGQGNGSVAVDQHTNTVYDTTFTTVAMINGSTCDATITTGCGQTPPMFTAGNFPFAVRVDQRTDTVYVANFGDNSVSIVDGRNCNATNTAGCGRSFPAVPVGGYPNGLAVSEATGTVYVANLFDDNVSVFGPNFAQK